MGTCSEDRQPPLDRLMLEPARLWERGRFVFFEPGREILLSRAAADTLRYLRELPDTERRAIGIRARERVLAAHTAAHRAAELEGYLGELL